jgi:hypothetical protein
MKRIIFTLIILTSTLLFTSCKKWLPENRIAGDWKLVSAEKKYLLSSDLVTTGYENGVFRFNDNGTASYTEASFQMLGNWTMREQHSGYYDSNGNWQDQATTIFTVRLYDFNANRVLDWYFTSIDFRSSGDKLIAFIDGASYTYKYDFRKQ